MPSLKSLRVRINSVKSTRKITSAMKMVAASKLRRSRDRVEAAFPYANCMSQILENLASAAMTSGNAPPLLSGNGSDKKILIAVITSDRGLCGGFNGSITKAARQLYLELTRQGKECYFYFIGKKGYEALHRLDEANIIKRMPSPATKVFQYHEAEEIAHDIIERFEKGEFDRCMLVYNMFKSVIKQEIVTQQLIPAYVYNEDRDSEDGVDHVQADYEYEPDAEHVLGSLLPKNIAVQVFRALLESAASEQGARMTAMDNATRNAGEMIKKLSLQYNRSRQAAITKELIEIISGAEAL